MRRVLLFSGTTEGRRLAGLLAAAGVESVVCVATEYGVQVMEQNEKIELRQGRLDEGQMLELLRSEKFLAVVDATHPFATEVSRNIKKSAEMERITYFRLKRDTGCAACAKQDFFYYTDSAACAKQLAHTEGNILLTTGSKDLACYCGEKGIKERLYVRVLPGVESIEKCSAAGILGKQIIALQGPFSEELNRVLFREYQIRHIVTKESGMTGGYPEKVSAAEREGITLHIIGNPERDEGFSFGQVCEQLERLTGQRIQCQKKLRITLLGTGMGTRKGMTQEGMTLLDAADVVFGAERLLELAHPHQKKFPYYLAQDILPILEDLEQEMEEELQAVILFSGDSGFYSGCEKLYRALHQWSVEKQMQVEMKITSGISSLSYFSAASGISWQDAAILSLHGRKHWQAEFRDAVRYCSKLFLLLSGVQNLREMGRLLLEEEQKQYRILVGYQLSYPEEEILELSPQECIEREKAGLYVCMILQETPPKRLLTHGRKDESFIRERVPMTKEEIREAAVCKLQLHENAVFYDIGSGTGSIAVEVAERSPSIQVFAVEQKENAVRLIEENCRKFRLDNVEIIHGKAPEGLESLPAATHAFIGGSSGRLMDILKALRRKNPAMRVVLTAITLETIRELSVIGKEIPIKEQEIVQMQVNRAKQVGTYTLMQAENPVYLCSFQLDG